jgi:3',5'-cyclic AMP phosphodiesterase CpdA
MLILHCSDVHITEDYSKVPWLQLGWRRWIALLELKIGGRGKQYLQAREVLTQIVQEGEEKGASHLVLSGDLTAYALEQEFSGARAALGAIGSDKRRCTVIPGNHDRYTHEVVADRLFEKYFGPLLESDLPEYRREDGFPFVRLLGDEAAVVGLGSARVPPLPGLSYGVVGRRQRLALREIVQDRRMQGRAVFVVVHHAPLTRSGHKDKLSHRLIDAEALFREIPGPRFALLHGHIHSRYYHPPTDQRPHIFCAGSSTQKGREGYWLIRAENGQIAGGVQQVPRRVND